MVPGLPVFAQVPGQPVKAMQLFFGGGDNRLVCMGRKSRIHFSGAVYHVMARGVDGRAIYAGDHDRIRFLESLELFQDRHRAIICANEAYLATLIRYIHQNPVRAGLVSKVCDWPWSSARLQPDAGADDPIKDFNPWLEEAKEEIVDLKRSLEAPREDLEELGSRIRLEFGVSIGELRSPARRPPLTSARSRLTKEAITRGHTLSAVAGWLQLSPSSVTRYSQHR